MTNATVSKLKSMLSAYLARVKAGDEVVVTERGRPIAKIVPIRKNSSLLSPHLEQLARSGKIRVGSGKLPKGFWKLTRPEDKIAAGLKQLLDDRTEGR